MPIPLDSASTIPSVPPSQSSPTPIVLSDPIIPTMPLQKSTRVSHTLAYLQAYQCNQVSKVPSSTSYPSSSYLSPHKLSLKHLHFCNMISSIMEPKFYHQVAQDAKWREAMATKISALEANHTWTLTPLPLNKRPIGCKWVYKVKYRSNGTMERYKARSVAKGFT